MTLVDNWLTYLAEVKSLLHTDTLSQEEEDNAYEAFLLHYEPRDYVANR